MRIGKKATYDGVLDIPEGVSGSFAIKHVHKAPGEPVQASNMRTAIYRGQTHASLRYDYATRWHLLTENDGVWMSDYPIEQIQIDEELKGFTGSVLVGGLGLGYAATALCRRQRVKRVVVVELSKDVINLVATHVAHPKLEVVHGDLFEYLRGAKERQERFTCGFYDIWTADGEATFHKTVIPLRQLSRGVVGRVTCWNEAVMRSQLAMGLTSRLMYLEHPEFAETLGITAEELAEFDETLPGAIFVAWAKPFWRWLVAQKPVPFERAKRVASTYASYYGRVPTEYLERYVLL